MIKYYCDRCGEEVPHEGARSPLRSAGEYLGIATCGVCDSCYEMYETFEEKLRGEYRVEMEDFLKKWDV